MAKAWRNEAACKINEQRKTTNVPTARVQKTERMAISKVTKNASTWLLDGLLIRAGIIDPLPHTHRVMQGTTYLTAQAPWFKRWKNKMAGFFKSLGKIG